MAQFMSPYQRSVYMFSVPGQPIPAPRLTQARKYDPRLHRDFPPHEVVRELVEDARAQVVTRGYYAFREAVVAALLDAYSTEPLFPRHIMQYAHPFHVRPGRSDPCAIVDYWLTMAASKRGTCTHGDPDNIAKAILDALFDDDRHVLPRCLSLACGSTAPGVQIRVELIGA
jgi:hypothetical protein